jgi:hypothetical protein
MSNQALIGELKAMRIEVKSKQMVADAYREVMGGDDWENEYQWYTNMLRGISLRIYHLSK